MSKQIQTRSTTKNAEKGQLAYEDAFKRAGLSKIQTIHSLFVDMEQLGYVISCVAALTHQRFLVRGDGMCSKTVQRWSAAAKVSPLTMRFALKVIDARVLRPHELCCKADCLDNMQRS